MIRVVVKTCDFGDAANIGGPVVDSIKSFDIEAPELEAHLTEWETQRNLATSGKKNLWWNRTCVGVEVLPAARQPLADDAARKEPPAKAHGCDVGE